MNTLIRSTTANRSRRSNGYEPLDHHHHHRQLGSMRRAFSRRVRLYSRSYKNERAKQRRIFLKSYNLAPAKKLGRRWLTKPRKLKKLAVKFTKALASVLSFLRIGSGRLRSCDCRLAIYASSPTPPAHRK